MQESQKERVIQLLRHDHGKTNFQVVEEIEGNRPIYRCTFGSKKLIVKLVPFENENANRLRNEVVMQKLVGKYLPDIVSNIIADDLESDDLGIVIIEDLGKIQTVMDILYSDDRSEAILALKQYYTLLARLHGNMRNQAVEVLKTQEKYKITTPRSDSNSDGRTIASDVVFFQRSNTRTVE